MSELSLTYRLGDNEVGRLGYGAMQLAGPGVFGPPADEARALQVLRDAVAAGVNHIDTSDFYGPHGTKKMIKQALHPFHRAGQLFITKGGQPVGFLIAARADFGDNRQVIRVGMQRLLNQFIGDVRAIKITGINMIRIILIPVIFMARTSPIN